MATSAPAGRAPGDDDRVHVTSRALTLSEPDEPIEEFLARVGVPPGCQVELRPAGKVPAASLEPTFDARRGAWTWALVSEGVVLGSWDGGSQRPDGLADEIVGAARRLLPGDPDHPVAFGGHFWPATQIERPAGTSEDDYLLDALKRHPGSMVQVGVAGAARPRAVVSDIGGSLGVTWNTLAGRRGPPPFEGWVTREHEAAGWLGQEVREAIGVPAGQALQAWSLGAVEETRVDDASGDAVAAVLAEPYRHGAFGFESSALSRDQLPTLRRSGPGSGIDETRARPRRSGGSPPSLLHVYPGPFRTGPLASWAWSGVSLDPDLATEAALVARRHLGLPPDAGLSASVYAVAGPDAALLGSYGERFSCGFMITAGLGIGVAALGSLAAGLLSGSANGPLVGTAAAVAGILTAAATGVGVALGAEALGNAACRRAETRPVLQAARDLDATWKGLATIAFLAPIAGAIGAAIAVSIVMA